MNGEEGVNGSKPSVENRLDRAEQLLPRRRFFDDMPDKGLFALVAILGFAAILFFKLQDYNGSFVAIGAVTLMIAYGIIAFRFRRVRMRPDRLGDNFYYLGFIFTLASLSAALLQIQIRKVASVDDLLGNFGIALFTTIIGVAGRVLFVQMRGDLDDVEDEVRRNLLAASADLRAQLSLALAEFETFHTGVKQAAAKTAEESNSVAQEAISSIRTTAQSAAQTIGRAFANEGDRVHELDEGITRIERSLKQLTTDLNDRLLDFSDRVQEMVNQLAATIDLLGRRKRRWYWPFRRQ
ncbi:hypothetical protein [Bradyrhizobium sp. 21]|uniref:hypothetical protein n=1 Tax=Bradyrhizobium sp. 21 TaxID=2782666 RepID=UPI001FFB229A|nr:hypothetical protein [Bradyrhizobium sp. 21]MCK1388724.1 hypothetical protein [Bradyrhizobium sp. 21]